MPVRLIIPDTTHIFGILISRFQVPVIVCAISLLLGCSHPVKQNIVYQQSNANGILFRAISLVGVPYRYGGNTPEGGFDCSGLVNYVFRDVMGINLPHSAAEMNQLNLTSISQDNLVGGDLLFFHDDSDRIAHVGIYVGEQRFVHAPNNGGTVRLDNLNQAYWKSHFSGAKRLSAPIR